jgi:hypothetical protein
MRVFAIIYFASMILMAIIAGFVATGCSTNRQIPQCEWDGSCDYIPPEAVEFDDGHYSDDDLNIVVEEPAPKKHLKKK